MEILIAITSLITAIINLITAINLLKLAKQNRGS